MVSENELLRLALMAHEAASDPGLWPRFLEGYTKAVAADFTVLQIHDVGQHVSTLISVFGLSSPFTQSYNEYYSKLNLWRERGQAFYRQARVNLCEELCPRPVLERSEFYNDYMLRIGGAFCMGSVLAREGDCAPTITALGRSPFGREQRETAEALLPHLMRAWGTYCRQTVLSAGESVLDALPLAIVFLAAGGRAVYWNRAAEEIFFAGDGLSLKGGVLTAADRRANARLGKAVDEALSPAMMPGPAAVQVPRASLLREYQILAAPLRGRLPQFAGLPAPGAVAFITDPARQRPAAADLLTQLYQLTPKEVMVAAKLSEGKSLKEAAQELSISYETARTHLRRIFYKTGTSRQGELLLLMSQLPRAA